MKLLNKYKMSEWAFMECFYKDNDIQEMRDLIDHSQWAYLYCRYVKDREEMWNKIKESVWAFSYCFNIKNRLEVRKYIKEKEALMNLDIMINKKEIIDGYIDC